MPSVPLPKPARGAVFVAFLIALVSGISVRSGPIMLLGICAIASLSAIGILLRRAWSAFGFALLLALSVLAMLLFAITGQSAGSLLQALISLVLYGAVAALFVLAGLSLQASGAKQGSPIPWILIALLLSAPFLVFRPVSVSNNAMEPTLLIGDFVLVDRFATHPASGDLVAYRNPRSWSEILFGRYRVGDSKFSASAIVGEPKFIYDSLAPDPADINKQGELTAPTHPPVRRWDRLFKRL